MINLVKKIPQKIIPGRKDSSEKLREKCQHALFQQMNIELIYYDVTTGKYKIKGNIPYLEPIFRGSNTITEILEKQKPLHPEFDFDEMYITLKMVCKGINTDPLEFPLKIGKKLHWMRLSLVDAEKRRGKVVLVVGALQDVTSTHETYMRMYEFIENNPGGLHRCHLSDPIHLEYVSEGFRQMLGYSKEEFDKKVGSVYTRAILEEDRDIFRSYVHRLSQKPSVETVEYRMVRKDGRILYVTDTMESVIAADGVMYGYSVVVDITEYHHNLRKQQLIIEEAKNTIRKKELLEGVLEEEKRHLAEELENLRIRTAISQMHPHFLYNTLGSIREVMLEDQSYAAELLCDFTNYLRACIRNLSQGDMIPFEQELQNIQSYVNIEKMRMGDKLNVVYDIQDTDFEIISLSIQPIVENAIRHGIYPKGRAGGTVTVRTRQEGQMHVIEVEDDGTGFNVTKVRQEVNEGKRDSVGLKNLEYRLQKEMNAETTVRSEIGKGTVVQVRVTD